MNKREEILAALSTGPTLRYALLNGRKTIFRLAYRRLLADGLIVESGTGGKGSPVYVGLPGAAFPASRYVGKVRLADVALLVRSGMEEADARAALQDAVDSPGDNDVALTLVLMEAHARIEERGGDPGDGLPMPSEKRAAHRPKKGEPFFNPLIPTSPGLKGKPPIF